MPPWNQDQLVHVRPQLPILTACTYTIFPKCYSRLESSRMGRPMIYFLKLRTECISRSVADVARQYCYLSPRNALGISHNGGAYVTWPRGRRGRGAMWRSGATQRRGARAARRAAMHIRAVICRCAVSPTICLSLPTTTSRFPFAFP